MKCPYCSFHESRVLDSRETPDDTATRRRRECLKCNKRFTTYERLDDIELYVVKKDGQREPFSREKVKRGITRACEKRQVSQEQIDALVSLLESEIRKKGMNEVNSSFIGEFIVKKLKYIDKVAYIRFASVYKDFEDVEDFKKVIQELISKRKQ